MTITKFYIICGFHEAGHHGIVIIEVFYMKIGFISLGCSKNLVDSEKMMGMINSGGLLVATVLTLIVLPVMYASWYKIK